MRKTATPTRLPMIRAFIFACLALLVAGTALASPQAAARDEALSREKQAAIVQRVAVEFREKYVFADVAEKMAVLIEGKFARGEYDAITGLAPLTARLQEDLRSVTKDLHIKVLPGVVPEFDDDPELLRRENYGFNAVEVLPGNIGYLDFFQFYAVKNAGPTAIAAMNFLANCDALIVDLRSNGGGYSELRSLICSYLFAKPVCLMEFRDRKGITQDWTLPYVPGPRLPKIPVYILISRFTFSCAEDFSFCLQKLGRAVVIGENTRGGAHDAQMLVFPAENISLQIPFNEALDPKTRTNWEGTGIKPDIPTPASRAFPVAVLEAVKALEQGATGGRKFLLEWIRQDYESQRNPLELAGRALRAYAGRYGSYRVVLEGGRLVLHLDESRSRQLVPIAADDFKMLGEDRHGYAANRVLFTRDKSGRINGLLLRNHDGDRSPLRPRN